jgi:hypothetical protein
MPPPRSSATLRAAGGMGMADDYTRWTASVYRLHARRAERRVPGAALGLRGLEVFVSPARPEALIVSAGLVLRCGSPGA